MTKTLKDARAYAANVGALRGETWLVFEIPSYSGAYAMGYRYAACAEDERAEYEADGAVFV